MTTFQISHQAKVDLAEIWAYIAMHSEPAANRLEETFHQKFNKLSNFPFIGTELTGVKTLSEQGIRFFPVDDYIIFYKPLSEGSVLIIRVIHSALDYTRVL